MKTGIPYVVEEKADRDTVCAQMVDGGSWKKEFEQSLKIAQI